MVKNIIFLFIYYISYWCISIYMCVTYMYLSIMIFGYSKKIVGSFHEQTIGE